MTSFSVPETASDDARLFESAASPATPAPLPHPAAHASTRSFWLDSSPPAPAASQPHADGDVDIAVIGSGITGISTVYHLAHAHELPPSVQSVAVFEARDFCSGATGRNGGHLTPASALAFSDLAANPAYLHRHIAAIEPASNRTDAEVIRRILTLEQETANNLIQIVENSQNVAPEDVELVNKKNWHLCFSASEEATFDGSLAAATEAGLHDFVQRVRKVTKEECDRAFDNPVGIRCAYEIPGGSVHPRRLVILLWELARRRAAQRKLELSLYTQTPIQKVESASGHSHTLLHTANGATFRARYVIHATNAYVSHLAPQLAGPNPHSELGVVPTRAQCIAALPAQQRTPWTMGMSIHEGFEYLHQRPLPPSSGSDQNSKPQPLIFGGGRYLSDTMEYGISDDGTLHPAISHFLRAFLPQTWPNDFRAPADGVAHATKLAPVSHEWTGIIGMTRSKNPLVGPLPLAVASSSADSTAHQRQAREPMTLAAVPGQYVAAGYSGHGMTRAFSCARIVVDMVLAEEEGKAEQWTLPDWFPACYLTMLPGARRRAA